MRTFLALTLAFLFAGLTVACSTNGDAAEDGEPLPATATRPAEPPAPPTIKPPPDATAYLPDGSSVQAGTGSSCWTESDSIGACIDKFGLITNADPVSLDAGSEVRLDNGVIGTLVDTAYVSVFPATGTPAVADNGEVGWRVPDVDAIELASTVTSDGVVFNADLDPGAWVIVVFLTGSAGDVSYGLRVDVQ